jgi:hypothetical protein
MDNFSVLVAALLERGVAIELRLTPSTPAPIASTQPSQPTHPTHPTQSSQSTNPTQRSTHPDLDALLYPEGIDG